jgi:hypothetical protein
MFRTLLIYGVLAAALAGFGCNARPPAGGSRSPKAEQARKQAEAMAVAAATEAAASVHQAQASRGKQQGNHGDLVARTISHVTGGLLVEVNGDSVAIGTPAGPKVEIKPDPRFAARPGRPPAIKVRVSSSMSHPTEADADEDALNTAAEVIRQKLAELDPPVHYRPSVNEVRNEFVRRDTRAVRGLDADERAELEANGIDPNRVYVSYDVEISADQVRSLRTRDRVVDGLRGLGGLTAAFLAGYLFLRFDERTKGYLTRWLAVGAVALAAGAAAAIYLV